MTVQDRFSVGGAYPEPDEQSRECALTLRTPVRPGARRTGRHGNHAAGAVGVHARRPRARTRMDALGTARCQVGRGSNRRIGCVASHAVLGPVHALASEVRLAVFLTKDGNRPSEPVPFPGSTRAERSVSAEKSLEHVEHLRQLRRRRHGAIRGELVDDHWQQT